MTNTVPPRPSSLDTADAAARPQAHHDTRITSDSNMSLNSIPASHVKPTPTLKRSATQRTPNNRPESSELKSTRRPSLDSNIRGVYNIRPKSPQIQKLGAQGENIGYQYSAGPEKESRIRRDARGISRVNTISSGQFSSKTRRTRRSPERQRIDDREFKRKETFKTEASEGREVIVRSLPVRALSAIKQLLPLEVNPNDVFYRETPALSRTARTKSKTLRQEYASSDYQIDPKRKRSRASVNSGPLNGYGKAEPQRNSQQENKSVKDYHNRFSASSKIDTSFRAHSLQNESANSEKSTPTLNKEKVEASFHHATGREIYRVEDRRDKGIRTEENSQDRELGRSDLEEYFDFISPERPRSRSSVDGSITLKGSHNPSYLEDGSHENEVTDQDHYYLHDKGSLREDESQLSSGIDHHQAPSSNQRENDISRKNPLVVDSLMQQTSFSTEHKPVTAKEKKLQLRLMCGHHATPIQSYRDSLSTTLSVMGNLNEEEHRSFTPPQRAPSSTSLAFHNSTIHGGFISKTTNDIYKPINYQPLKDFGFRILVIEPGAVGSKIITRIGVFNHNDSPIISYEALSYMWGQEPAIHRIFVNENPHLIRPNLFHALQRIRDKSQRVYLWVDSLCINQCDEFERNLQVRQMDRIFQNAENVCIWLGEEDTKSKNAMDFIPQVFTPDFFGEVDWCKDFRLKALNQLLERPWFRRGWVLQEAAFSKNSIIFCGEHQIHMKSFDDAIKIIRKRLNNMPQSIDRSVNDVYNFHDSPATTLLDTIEHVFLKRDTDGPILRKLMSLEALVELGTFCETTDPRDAIYSLLNLASDTTSVDQYTTIIPDYGKHLLDVYSDFIMHCSHQSNSLDIICRPWAPVPDIERSSDTTKVDLTLKTHIPSWISTRDCLQFGDPSRRNTRRLHGKPLVGSCRQQVYNAHDTTHPQIRIGKDSKTKACNGSLYAKGIIIGEVKHRSTRMADAIVSKECLNMLSHGTGWRSADHTSVPDIIWRTLCGNRDDKGNPAQSIYHFAMLELLQLVRGVSGSISSIDVEELLKTPIPNDVAEYLRIVREVVWNRRIFRGHGVGNNHGTLVGLIPQYAREGDKLCILFGCSVPLVLREQYSQDNTYNWQLIGEAYIHGFMDGQGICSMTDESLNSSMVEFEIK
jgi:Heterokaryon incompatibility protein (HET)